MAAAPQEPSRHAGSGPAAAPRPAGAGAPHRPGWSCANPSLLGRPTPKAVARRVAGRPGKLPAMTERLYTWCGVDDPDRFDRASIEIRTDAMRAVGTASTRNFATSWELSIGPGWITRALRVTARGFGWWRSLNLTRSVQTGWRAESEGSGDPDLPPPGLADPPSIAAAVDCDLGLCPVTNTMPIRRLGLLDREVPETTLVM